MRIRLSFAEIFPSQHLSAFSSLSSHDECCYITKVFSSSAKPPSTGCHISVEFRTPKQTIPPRLVTKRFEIITWAVRLSQNKMNLDSFSANCFNVFSTKDTENSVSALPFCWKYTSISSYHAWCSYSAILFPCSWKITAMRVYSPFGRKHVGFISVCQPASWLSYPYFVITTIWLYNFIGV